MKRGGNRGGAAASERAAELRRQGTLIAVGVFVTFFATHLKMAKLPLQSLIKDRFHLGPDAVADFFAVAGIALYVKPLAALVSDEVPLLGSRRRSYLVLSGTAGVALWSFAAASAGSYRTLLVAFVAISAAAVLGNTVLGGILVEQGRRHDASGGLSLLRVSAMNAAALAAGPVGGWLAGRAHGRSPPFHPAL